jgi:hypothetical protein
LADDWSTPSLVASVREAMNIYQHNPSEYAEIVERCRAAAESELNWDFQFKKIVPLLK